VERDSTNIEKKHMDALIKASTLLPEGST